MCLLTTALLWDRTGPRINRWSSLPACVRFPASRSFAQATPTRPPSLGGSRWRRKRPVALVLTRQDVATLDRTQCAAADGLRQGAYVLIDAPGARPDVILMASGSEVGLIMEAQKKLQDQKVQARVVSMPSWELFDLQPKSYRDQVLVPAIHARLAVEAGVSQGWHRYVGDQGEVLSVERFGASAPGDVVMREYGFTVDNVCQRALALLR